MLQTMNQYYGNSYLPSLPAIGYITRNYIIFSHSLMTIFLRETYS